MSAKYKPDNVEAGGNNQAAFIEMANNGSNKRACRSRGAKSAYNNINVGTASSAAQQQQTSLLLPPALRRIHNYRNKYFPPPERRGGGHRTRTGDGRELELGERIDVCREIAQAWEYHEKWAAMLPIVEAAQAFLKDDLRELRDRYSRKRDAILSFAEEPSLFTRLLHDEQGLLQLVQFKIRNGHCNVPVHKKSDPSSDFPKSLVNFAIRVRRGYRSYLQREKEVEEAAAAAAAADPTATIVEWKRRYGGDTAPTSEHLKQKFEILERLGFRFPPEEPHDVIQKKNWDEKFELLKQYKEKEGHCNVPQLHPVLGSFVSQNRKGHEAWLRGAKPRAGYGMTQERVDRLESLGFVWKLRHGRPKKGEPKFRNKAMGIGYDDQHSSNRDNDNDGKGEDGTTLSSNDDVDTASHR